MPVAPYGSWPSPITPDLLVERAVHLDDVVIDGDDVYWVEGRPSERGRQALVRSGQDVTPPDFSARTLVHEYGGRCVAVHDGVVFASNFADQRLWRIDPGRTATPITAADRGWRFADPDVSPDGQWVYCVRETHAGANATEVRNEIVRVPADGSTEPEVLVSGPDFVAAPRLSPDGRQLAWLSWNHPDMPWDSTELRVDGRLVAGGPGESVSQPRWSPDGELCWVSDRSGWWNLPMVAMEADFSRPDWEFGRSTYTFLDDGRLVAAWHAPGGMRLGLVDRATGSIQEIDQPFTELASLHTHGDAVVAVAASPTTSPAVVRISVPGGAVEVLARSRPIDLDPAVLSVPESIEFPTTEGDTARALYYPPRNGDWTGPAGERPPLLVTSHGGPTSQASSTLALTIQWWTSRGIAVVDVDYRGSSGYGREYRQRLQGNWGVFDVDDCVHAAAWLAERGDVDPER
ncbi:MAG TPA: prolyl oligopeptidase family serine peptidase, partial [Acidimicrobiales bacterium]|nr:prolyl oligopeptidase family serine peptidase [Acidimicrobiales bacterium]